MGSRHRTVAPTLETVVIPTPNGPGICGRSPEVQRTILENLKINLCRVVTQGELFRITTLGVKMDAAKAGDFHGLVNLDRFGAEIKDVEPGGFSGMKNLKEMYLTVYTYGSIAPGAFQGLNNLEKLTINISKPDSEQENTLTLSDFDHLPSLKHLEMESIPRLYAETVSHKLLANLPSLESVRMGLLMRKSESDKEIESDIHIPEELFAANRMLKTAVIGFEDRKGEHGAYPREPVQEQLIAAGSEDIRERHNDPYKHLPSPRQAGGTEARGGAGRNKARNQPLREVTPVQQDQVRRRTPQWLPGCERAGLEDIEADGA